MYGKNPSLCFLIAGCTFSYAFFLLAKDIWLFGNAFCAYYPFLLVLFMLPNGSLFSERTNQINLKYKIVWNFWSLIWYVSWSVRMLQDYGHRVRLATHSNFKEFVLTAGLEFYPIGGDPKILAECMYQLVNNLTCISQWFVFTLCIYVVLLHLTCDWRELVGGDGVLIAFNLSTFYRWVWIWGSFGFQLLMSCLA